MSNGPSKEPEVLWRDATERNVEIYYRGGTMTFELTGSPGNERARYTGRANMMPWMPNQTYLKVCEMARRAMTDHALRSEQKLRAMEKLTDAMVECYCDEVCAYAREGRFRITSTNVWNTTADALMHHLGRTAEIGIVRAVSQKLIAEQHTAAGRTRAANNRAFRRARAQLELPLTKAK